MTDGGSARRVDTPGGPAELVIDRPSVRERAGLLVLGHGAGGGIDAPDLRSARDAALAAGWVVARVVQPYRVAGRRSPAPAARLDEVWLFAVGALRRTRGLGGPLVVGGRSSGARVACRTAVTSGADAVLALAFPLHPPGRPERDRADELRGAGVPVEVVQGDRDAFGSATDIARLRVPGVSVHAVEGADHALRTADAARVVADVTAGVLARLSRRVAG